MAPTQSGGMPPLTQHIEGLRSPALLVSVFVGPPEATPAQRRWRSWLVHYLTKAARHYENARKLTVMDAKEGWPRLSRDAGRSPRARRRYAGTHRKIPTCCSDASRLTPPDACGSLSTPRQPNLCARHGRRSAMKKSIATLSKSSSWAGALSLQRQGQTSERVLFRSSAGQPSVHRPRSGHPGSASC